MRTPKTFRELARENTGSHFLDSGSAYGYHYQRGAIPPDQPVLYAHLPHPQYHNLVRAPVEENIRVSMPALLDQYGRIDRALTARLWQAAERQPRAAWEEILQVWTRRQPAFADWDWDHVFSEYTYNVDNWLDQDFIFWARDSDSDLVIIRTHNGCDARGGFSSPVVARFPDGINPVLDEMRLDSEFFEPCWEHRDRGSVLVSANYDVGYVEITCPGGESLHIIPAGDSQP